MKSQYVLPITIVVAGLLIAGAVLFVGKTTVPTTSSNPGQTTARAYDPAVDHILGNPNARIKVVEYMDLECPHCKDFHTTMHQIIDHYNVANPGEVAWVQRAFPLASIHSKAPQEAEAAECAAEVAGNEGYWKFVDRLFEVSPTNNGLDLSQLPVIAKDAGLNVDAFNKCVAGNTYAKKVSDSYNEAIKLGAQGTPFTLIMVGTDAVTLPGGQPYNSMIAAIDAVLSSLPGNSSASTTPQ